MAATIYTPLYKSLQQMRLLVLQPSADFAAPIECSLHISDHLAEDEPYRAISYAWGDLTITKPILVNGIDIQITVNLESALHYIRDPSKPAVLWADVVCINQADDHEKSYQVALMGHIFGHAESVIVWLGQPTEDTDRVMDYTSALASMLSGESIVDSDDELTFEDHERIIDSIPALFQFDWWSRLWVIQEVRLARAAHFVCGHKRVSDQAMAHMLERATFPSTLSTVVQNLIVDWLIILLAMRSEGPEMTGIKNTSLFYLLTMFPNPKVTKPEDRVYALLSVAFDGAIFDSPDYTQSLVDVYTGVALSHYRKRQSLRFLQLAGVDPSGDSQAPSLPILGPRLETEGGKDLVRRESLLRLQGPRAFDPTL